MPAIARAVRAGHALPTRVLRKVRGWAGRTPRALSHVSLRRLLLVVGALSLLVRLPFMVGPVDARTVPDWGNYWVITNDLLAGGGFRLATEFRTPGYPLLLAAVSYLPGSLDHGIVVVQHVAGVGVTLAVVCAAWRYFGRVTAVVTALVAVLSPVLVDVEGNMMPDFLLGAFAIAGALVLARALEDTELRLRLVAAAGVLLGFAALIKPVGQALLLVGLVPFLIQPRQLRRGLLPAAVLGGCFVLTISPWLVRNVLDYGNVRMSSQDALGLWLREFDWDKRPIPVETAQGRLLKPIFDATVIKDGPGRPTSTNEYVIEVLTGPPYNYTQRQATDVMRTVAIQAIRDAPKVYAHGTWTNLQELSWTWFGTTRARYSLDAKIQAAHPVLWTRPSTEVFALAKVVDHWWRFLSMGFAAIFLLPFTRSRRRLIGVLTLAAAWLAIEGATAAGGYPDTRYASPMDPVLWVLGSAAAVLVVQALVRQIKAGWHPARALHYSDPHRSDLERAIPDQSHPKQ
jgi:4-amino-4-deoxy-L-arabinose transferase-like glycosyltransferase